MNKGTLDFIKSLSLQDPKSLSQKALKGSEEMGELSKKVLSFEGAAHTAHRFVRAQEILEECADVILCAMSMAYSLGFDDSELESMLIEKTNKWQSLVGREKRTRFPLAYEMHVTVDNPGELEQFRQVCSALGVKPIVLALQERAAAQDITQVMTSSNFAGDDGGAREELNRISAGLKAAGYSVSREKIECAPWHPAAPLDEDVGKCMPQGCYFESHLQVELICENEFEQVAKESSLKTIALEHSAHYSRNMFKQYAQLHYTRMLTVRSYTGTLQDFKRKVLNLGTQLKQNGFNIQKEVIEFSLYDSNTALDKTWAS